LAGRAAVLEALDHRLLDRAPADGAEQAVVGAEQQVRAGLLGRRARRLYDGRQRPAPTTLKDL
jgi:hypothetical protein